MGVAVEAKRAKQTRPGTKRSELPRPKGLQALAFAYSHPLRVRILAAMNSPKRRASPVRLAEEWGEDLSKVAYHFRELEAYDLVEVVEEHKRRGSTEHVYEPKATALAWDREWHQMPPVFKQSLLALTGRLGFEAMGASIDSGAFESREDTVLAQDTMRVDERGAKEALALLEKTVELLMKIATLAEDRLEESGEEGLLISYMAVGYEGSLRPV
jgi:predicted ArsR family transcriptional regulator